MSTTASDLGELPLAADALPAGSPAAPLAAAYPDVSFRLRPGPILVVVFLALTFRWAPGLVIDLIADFVTLPVFGASLPRYFVDHTVMLLMALGLIGLASRRSRVDYGLHMPRGRSFVATAIVLSVMIGIFMAVVDYAPYIFGRIAPPLDYSFSSSNVGGWMIFYGLYSGPTEEIAFRGLLVTYLTSTMPGKIRYRRMSMNGAGVVVAAIFALGMAVYALMTSTLLVALAQVSYVFAFGLFAAYWLEKSKSILAPAIGHNVAWGMKQALLFAMVAAWR
jgi:hypothetical protein